MYNVGDYVVYKRDVCKVIDYKEKHIRNIDYYLLRPIYDETLKIDVPVNSSFLRRIISKDKASAIIDDIPNIEVIDVNDKLMESEYRRILKEDDLYGLIKIIKTTYLRNKDRIDNKRKISEKDDSYFKLAEKYLYGELAVAFEMSYDDMKDYIINRVNDLESNK